MQFRVLGYLRLDEQRGNTRIEACGQPIDRHAPGVLLELRGVLIARGQGMPIGNEEVALVLILQFDPILQRTVKISQMQLSGWAHARQHASILCGSTHAEGPTHKALMSCPMARYAGSNSQPNRCNTFIPNTMNN